MTQQPDTDSCFCWWLGLAQYRPAASLELGTAKEDGWEGAGGPQKRFRASNVSRARECEHRGAGPRSREGTLVGAVYGLRDYRWWSTSSREDPGSTSLVVASLLKLDHWGLVLKAHGF